MTAFGYSEIFKLDSDDLVYTRTTNELREVTISEDIFDDKGRLKPVEPGSWDRTFVTHTTEDVEEDDIPF
jgi:hypothetical protein